MKVCGHVKAGDGRADATIPFGSINVILFGDFHQFPLVRNVTGALYCNKNTTKRASIGHAIYQQFETVITLTEQMRIRDTRWMELLARAREGECTEEDLKIIKSLVLTDEDCNVPDFSRPPWNEAILVTPRHSARIYWNEAALSKHCKSTGHILYQCDAEDTAGNENRPLTMAERVTVAKMSDKKTGKLPGRLQFAVGMKAMVVLNIATEADLANGARGKIVEVVLDPREIHPTANINGITVLKYPPAMLMFRPYHHTFQSLDGLPDGLIPIFPSQAKFSINVAGHPIKITRRVPALMAAYAFTDYKSQGQTIEYVIVDLGKPASGDLNGFNAYVALSRSRGRDTIRLLREFRSDIFTHHPSEDLRAEDRRQDRLTDETSAKFAKGLYTYRNNCD